MTTSNDSSRRDLLRLGAVSGVGLGLHLVDTVQAAPDPRALLMQDANGLALAPPRPAGHRPVYALQTPPLQKVRCAVIGLSRGMTLLNSALHVDFVEVVAVCDIIDERAQKAFDLVKRLTGNEPAVYRGNEDVWQQMVAREDIDVVYIATPWEWHVPMAVQVMEQGKHAFLEVAAAVTVKDCWRLVDTSEKTQKHCVILENCCYGEQELFVLHMARQGLFGELKHAECAYIHNLAQDVLWSLGSEGDWRRNYHTFLNGNLYPTHGLGSVAQYLGIGRGDAFKFVVSVSSPEYNLTQIRDATSPNQGKHAQERYVCGDMNTSIIKTHRGRTIMIQHDVVSPRPYSRINALSGTQAMFVGYPGRLAVDARNPHPSVAGLQLNAHKWLEGEGLASFMRKNAHPLIKKVGDSARNVGGHGGMDHVMNFRLLDCLRQGITPDMTVYDAADWSSIIELSVRSVQEGSMPIACPDFTRGAWQTLQPLGIVA